MTDLKKILTFSQTQTTSGSLTCACSAWPNWIDCLSFLDNHYITTVTLNPNLIAERRVGLSIDNCHNTFVDQLENTKSLFCFRSSPGRSNVSFDNEIVMMNHVYKERFPKVRTSCLWIGICIEVIIVDQFIVALKPNQFGSLIHLKAINIVESGASWKVLIYFICS